MAMSEKSVHMRNMIISEGGLYTKSSYFEGLGLSMIIYSSMLRMLE